MPAPILTTLASAGRINPTPALERYTLESPWLLMGVLALAGFVAFWVFNTRGKLRIGFAAAAIGLALAGGVFALASMVTTPREEIMHATRELVRTVVDNDKPGARLLLDDTLRFDVPRVTNELDRESVLTQIDRAHDIVEMRGHRVLAVRADTRGPEIGRSLVEIWLETSGAPPRTTWQIDWARLPDGRWVATRIEAVNIPGIVGGP